ncbi:hypothetical protein ACIRU5_09630 [Streptomyces misionensis]|uniref:hypothetical protein n=1 Tax=Streptomyces misionensis TaxID=67331 RepID=UPI00382911B1
MGMGAAYGSALMIKAGYNGIGMSDVVYMSDVVNRAAKLAAQGSKDFFTPPIMIDYVFGDNLNDDIKKLVTNDSGKGCYTANNVNTLMENWHEQNCP